MFKRLLFVGTVLAGPAFAATYPSPIYNDVTVQGGINGTAQSANLAALLAASTATHPQALRLNYVNPGDSPPVLYTASNSACSLNAGAGDNGSQVPSANGKCWIAIPPASGWDVRIFGALCDGSTDDSTPIQSAITAAGSTAVNKVFIPSKVCVAQNLSVSSNNVGIVGPTYSSEAAGGATIQAATTSSTVLTVGVVDGFTISNIKFTSPSQQIAGNYLYLNGTVDSNINDVFFLGGWDPVKFNNATIVRWTGGSIRNWSDVGWSVTGTAASNGGGNDYYLSKFVMDEDNATFTPVAGIMISQNGGSITLDTIDIIHAHNALLLNPGAGQFVNWVYATNAYFDSCDFASNLRGGIGINFAPTGTGIINGGSFANSWSSTCTTNVSIAGSATTSISGVKFSNFESVNAYHQAFYLNYANDISISNPTIAGSSQSAANTYSSIEVDANANRVNITGGRVGATVEGYTATAKFNLQVDSGFGGTLAVNGVDLTGAGTSPVFDAATAGAAFTIVNSPGYSPVGPGTIAVGASPFTYQAGRSPQTVYIKGGTVSSVAYGAPGGVVACTASPCTVMLAPEQPIQVTYTVAPTMSYNAQ